MPKFSVIIPLYNKERDIEMTLSSVFAQTFTDYEIVLVDDGSTDGSAAVVKSLNHPKIVFYTKKNEGVALTRNFAVSKAVTNHVAFLDADDYWHPNHLENLNNLILQFPDNSWFATAYEKKHNDQLITPMISPIMESSNWQGIVDNYFKHSLIDALAWTSAVCFRKDFFTSLHGFDHTITNGAGEDTDLWIRAALAAPLAFSNTISARHNLDGSNRISHTPTLHRNFMNVDNYNQQAANDSFLKKYLDLNRYSFAIQHKLAGDKKTFKKYANQIDLKNITSKQRFLLNKPVWMLKLFLNIKVIAEKLGWRVTSFK